MTNIYDNGTCLLGTKKAITDYIIPQFLSYNDEDKTLSDEEYKDILREIKDFKDNDILCINYCGMGLSIEGWSENDKILEVL